MFVFFVLSERYGRQHHHEHLMSFGLAVALVVCSEIGGLQIAHDKIIDIRL
jgi:hypothetical protein